MIKFLNLICFLVVFTQLSFAQTENCKKTNQTVRSEIKKLKKNFGINLPIDSVIVKKIKTTESKNTFLFIEMSVDEARKFKESLRDGPFPKGKRIEISIDDKDCWKQENTDNCYRIGFANYPTDAPREEIANWSEDMKFNNDLIAFFRKDGLKKFVSMLLDSQKGLLILWYKI